MNENRKINLQQHPMDIDDHELYDHQFQQRC